jgi:hypothetical protein
MKPWVLTVVFIAAAVAYLVRASRSGKAAGEVVHALMCLGMVVMAWASPAGHLGVPGWLGQALALAFFLGALWAVAVRAPASCLMAFGMAITFTSMD